MWTPKRIVLLVVGFVLFLTAYVCYTRYLGGIDGLPALPREDEEQANGTVEPPPTPPNTVEALLRRAFGEDCKELVYAIKLEVGSKGLVLASKEFQIEPDGRVRLTPLSLALFKPHPDGQYPEINTITSDVAYLTFDRPIVTPADMGRYKIVGGELVGHVDIINNRSTPQRDDDLNVFTPGPLYFRDDEHRVWTNTTVKMTDFQTKPDPQTVDAVGMDLYLTTEEQPRTGAATAAPEKPSKPGKPAPIPGDNQKSGHDGHKGSRKKTETVKGVERIVLHQDVRMDLYLDSGNGFLSSDDKKDKKKGKEQAKAAPEETKPADAPKSHVVIKTQGPFNYDMIKQHAQFDVSAHPGPFPNRVSVTRFRDLGQLDELDCERLEIQFRPKAGTDAKATREDHSPDLEIENAHATGKEVLLKSDAEVLEAYGDDFFYDASTGESILKSQTEMWALKEGNEIHARELRMVQQKGAQQATALGPGRIALLDKATGKRPLHARWTDKLVSSRDGAYDLLVLTQDAAFLDDEHQQTLQADTLKVWLEPSQEQQGKAAPDRGADPRPATADSAGEHHGRRPHHVEAIGHVFAKSQEMNVHDTERLNIWFQDPPAAGTATRPPGTEGAGPPGAAAAIMQPPDREPPLAGAPAKPEGPLAPQGSAAAPPGTSPAPGARASGGNSAPGTQGGKTATDSNQPTRPIDLSAHLVEAHVLRNADKNELEFLWTEGTVRVKQAPSGPDDKGVDIQGETLKLKRKTDGNLLEVTGGNNGSNDLAQLRMDKIYIVGPVVNIDQVANKAWVNGTGAMQMDSNTNFQGGKLDHPVPLTVHWSKAMLFEGQSAEFHGGVEAEQESTTLLCQSMRVFLDRPVSLKGSDKGQPPAKVRSMVCDQMVRVESIDRDPKGQIVKRQRIECPEMEVDNEESSVHASGPGVVRILQPGSAEPVQATPGGSNGGTGTGQPANVIRSNSKNSASADQLQLTIVKYAGRMYANDKTHTAIFTDDVHVVHVPSNELSYQPNLDKLPEGGLYLHSDRLEVYSRQEDGKTTEEIMRASGHCAFQTQDSYGDARVITYDQVKDQVILTGNAHVFRDQGRGLPRQTIAAEKIIYLRKTGEFHGIDNRSFESGH